MFAAIALAVGAAATWILVDQWLLWRDKRLHGGSSEWDAQFGAGRAFHSTGFEDTVPAADATLALYSTRFDDAVVSPQFAAK